MSAYVIAMVDVRDPETYKQYTQLTPDTIKAHGGRFVVRGGEVQALEGQPFNERLVILEFPDRETLLAWFNSKEYQEVRKLRLASADSRFLVVDGAAEGYAPDAQVVRTS